jgi:hypothetical protein
MDGRQSRAPLSQVGYAFEASEVGLSNQNKRAIVRKRTQQLVYLELGRDNGGVMLNLSEEGCGFQAITPVKCGETRFAFQISGGRRISGEAEVVWVDDLGIMGGLRFLNLPLEARKQIRRWLEETKAPEEHGSFDPVPLPQDLAARGMRDASKDLSTDRARDYRQSSPAYGAAPAPAHVPEEPAAAPAWANLRASIPPPQDERFPDMPLLRDDGAYANSRPRSAALWRGIAVMALATAVAAMVVAYQHEVGNSLIWLGETLSGKTKASGERPESKPPATNPSPAIDSANSATPAEGAVDSSKPEEQKTFPANTTPAQSTLTPTTPKSDSTNSLASSAGAAVTGPAASGRPASKLDTINSTGRAEHAQSALDRQQIPRNNNAGAAPNPETWSASDSVESLWGAVQGGSVAAERSLAERFVHGEGVAKNCDQAKVLLKAAADRGSREARLRLYELETGGCQ